MNIVLILFKKERQQLSWLAIMKNLKHLRPKKSQKARRILKKQFAFQRIIASLKSQYKFSNILAQILKHSREICSQRKNSLE
jgi:hypothetical protein